MKRNIIIAAIASTFVIGTGTVVGMNAYHNNEAKENVKDTVDDTTTFDEAKTLDVEESMPVKDTTEKALYKNVEDTKAMANENIDKATPKRTCFNKRNLDKEKLVEENPDKENPDKENSKIKEKKITQVKEEAPQHSHNYNKTITATATCVTNGAITYTCECGNSYEESVPAFGHNFGEGATCSICGVSNPNYVAPHTHTWIVEEHFTLNHTNEGHYAPYICECRLDFQSYEELEAHQEETAIKSREAYRDENGEWHGEIAHGGWCNGWVVEREWDIYTVTHKEVCECGAVGNEWVNSEEVTCTCIHYGPDMHFHFADRDCCRG